MHLIVKTQIISAIKDVNKKKRYNVKNIDGNYLPALNEKVLKIIEESIERARKNGRKTLMNRDI